MTSVVGLTELLNVTVTPAPGSVQDSNLTEVAGNAVDTGVGASGAGTQRVALSSDSKVTMVDGVTPITAALTTNGTLFTVETFGYNTISVQLSGDWQALCTFQVSNDNVFWANVQGYTFNNFLNSINTAQDNGVYIFPVTGRYFRVVVSNYKAGTVSTVSYLRQQSLAGIGETMLTQAMDPSNGTPIQTTFAGIQGPGQQPAANSMPVALANEQILDKYIFGKAYTQTSTYLGFNMLLPQEQASIDPGAPLDCLQYRSIYFQFNSGGVTGGANGVNATFLPEISNDLVNWTNTEVFRLDGGSAVGVTPTRSINPANIGGNALYGANLSARYFRLRCSGFITTVFIQFTTTLRMTPMTVVTETYTNFAQQNGSSLAQGVTNFNSNNQGVTTTGGQTSSGISPLLIGATDHSVVRQEMLGAPINPAVTAYNFGGPWARQANVDVAGAFTVSGPMPFMAEEKTTPVNVRLERSTNGQDSVQDLLQQILVELKALSYYTRELPVSIALAVSQGNPLMADPGSMSDDPENFYNDPTLSQYRKGN